MEDPVYDRFYRELSILETNNPSLITSDSPTQRIGGKASKEFKNIKHEIPLLSLDNAFNIEELRSWYYKTIKHLEKNKKIQINSKKISLMSELKIDGNAIALRYENGLLTKAATRGDGAEGEDITSNVRTITSIPLALDLESPPRWIEIRGEAFIPKKTFEVINEARKLKDQDVFANPRNACAGTLRQLDPKVVASRKLDFFAYTIYSSDNWESKKEELKEPISQWINLNILREIGFKVNPHSIHHKNLEEVISYYKDWESRRKDLPYDTDGIVIKVNHINLQNVLGSTQKAPRWAIAVKYPAEEAATKLKRLIYQVGRTGAITPVAEFDPVLLAGTSVNRATLHNAKRILDLDLCSEDTIIIHKAGEIIPEVIRVIPELRVTNAKEIRLPTKCPECSYDLTQEPKAAVTKCINKDCPAIIKGLLVHWASKGSMDINGLGQKLIDQLVTKKLVSSIGDLYKLDIELLTNLDRFGTKSAENLCNELINSLEKSWAKQLYGLGIFHVGETNAKALAKAFKNINELATAAKESPDSISQIYGIGNEITYSIQNWFANENNLKLIDELQRVGFSLGEDDQDNLISRVGKVKESKKLDGKIFVITGSLSSMSRKEAQELIEKEGGKLVSALSNKTNYLISGNNPGSKLKKAQNLNTEIINETDFKNLLTVKKI